MKEKVLVCNHCGNEFSPPGFVFAVKCSQCGFLVRAVNFIKKLDSDRYITFRSIFA